MSNDKTADAIENFLFLIGSILSMILVISFYAFVFSKLWAWFIVPFFHLPLMPIAIAAGILVLVKTLNPPLSDRKKIKEAFNEYGKLGVLFRGVGEHFLSASILLLAGFVIKHWFLIL